MSKAAKPAGAQTAAKPGAEEAAGAPPKKSRKKLIIIIIVLALIAAGAAAFFLMGSGKRTDAASADSAIAEQEARSKIPPKFVDLGTFTANLVREDGDRYLQVSITLKITKPELEEKIKASSPEILHYVNMVLQSKRPSELADLEGKKRLADQIKEQVEYVLGLRKKAPPIGSEQTEAKPAGARPIRTDLAEVLFTSFIIQ